MMVEEEEEEEEDEETYLLPAYKQNNNTDKKSPRGCGKIPSSSSWMKKFKKFCRSIWKGTGIRKAKGMRIVGGRLNAEDERKTGWKEEGYGDVEGFALRDRECFWEIVGGEDSDSGMGMICGIHGREMGRCDL